MLKSQTSSVFDKYRQQAYQPLEWFQSSLYLSIDPSQFLCEGNLWECVGSRITLFCHYILMRNVLIRTRTAPFVNSSLSSLKPGPSSNYYMYLANPKLKKIQVDDMYGFRLTAGSEVKDFLCSSKKEMLMWYEFLKEVTVLEDFVSKYSMEKLIGSGSFAHVKVGKSKRTQEKFAIKSVSKNKLSQSSRLIVSLLITKHILRITL